MKKNGTNTPIRPEAFLIDCGHHRALFLNRPKDLNPGGRFLNHGGPAPFALGGQHLFDKDIAQTADG